MGAKVIIFGKLLNSNFVKGLVHSALSESHLIDVWCQNINPKTFQEETFTASAMALFENHFAELFRDNKTDMLP